MVCERKHTPVRRSQLFQFGRANGWTMKAIIQRVLRGSVTVDGKVIAEIGKGLVVLVGINRDWCEKDSKWICNKIANIRLWPNEDDKPWQKSAKALGYEVLLVSQFTLDADLSHGNKPNYRTAMNPSEARVVFDNVVSEVKKVLGDDKVQMGAFGEMMTVEIVNDGPVTIPLEKSLKKTEDNNNNN